MRWKQSHRNESFNITIVEISSGIEFKTASFPTLPSVIWPINKRCTSEERVYFQVSWAYSTSNSTNFVLIRILKSYFIGQVNFTKSCYDKIVMFPLVKFYNLFWQVCMHQAYNNWRIMMVTGLDNNLLTLWLLQELCFGILYMFSIYYWNDKT